MMLEEKSVEIGLSGGGTKTFILSKFPAIAGREIITQYPISGLPKIGDYETNEQIMFKIMAFVQVPMPGDTKPIALTTPVLIDNHVPDWETLARIEWAMMEHNVSFFREGRVSSFLDDLLETLPESISLMLTPLLERLLQKSTPPSESSRPSTH